MDPILWINRGSGGGVRARPLTQVSSKRCHFLRAARKDTSWAMLRRSRPYCAIDLGLVTRPSLRRETLSCSTLR